MGPGAFVGEAGKGVACSAAGMNVPASFPLLNIPGTTFRMTIFCCDAGTAGFAFDGSGSRLRFEPVAGTVSTDDDDD